mmetsp:Transcript_8448/g.52837  ORF Transcript_8448/g.52837 Transcript_8448/m.52837 type:complete len:106 (-) Transcript_8448:611-928(-)
MKLVYHGVVGDTFRNTSVAKELYALVATGLLHVSVHLSHHIIPIYLQWVCQWRWIDVVWKKHPRPITAPPIQSYVGCAIMHGKSIGKEDPSCAFLVHTVKSPQVS